ncbi:MAG TPA: cytochrome c biogenesis protein ResB, partial [Roseimicrobium sp.]|nr:cytochrome c biogenesis protein ResB [Roseimicrobium sp.]
QERWFRSFFIWYAPAGSRWEFPFFPGGYLVGFTLLINLLSAHFQRFKFTKQKIGIYLTHVGIILLLVGQLATDMLSYETQMRLAEGEAKTFSESSFDNELVFLNSADGATDDVISIPERLIVAGGEIRHEKLPFTAKVKSYYVNAGLRQRAPMVDKGEPPATQGVGPKVTIEGRAETRKMNERNLPVAVLDIVTPQGSVGTWLVSTMLAAPQEIKIGDQTWRVALRWKRVYHPFNIVLLKTTHEIYKGTVTSSNPEGIPKNFQSRVRIENPKSGENREVDIYMNNPLRYAGLTFFQYQMGQDEMNGNTRGTSTLQVVRNPGWLTPYAGCVVVGAGMLIQFMTHLVGFIKKRRTA